MKIEELGFQVRQTRVAHKMTQEQLAKAAGVSRTTVNLLENGLLRDVGLRKAQSILSRLGLSLSIQPETPQSRPDFVKMASTTASIRSRNAITEDALRRVFVTGKIQKDNRAQVRELLESAPSELIAGLVQDIRARHKPGRIERNLFQIAQTLDIPTAKVKQWM